MIVWFIGYMITVAYFYTEDPSIGFLDCLILLILWPLFVGSEIYDLTHK